MTLPAPMLFKNVTGFCPVRDPNWPAFVERFIEDPLLHLSDCKRSEKGEEHGI